MTGHLVKGSSGVIRPRAAGAGAGPNTSQALAGTQSVPDATPTAVVFDTDEASANLVAGVPTVPADGDYWVAWSAGATSTGFAGAVTGKVSGSTYGDIDEDVLPPGQSGTAGTVSGARRVALTATETLSVTITGATGAAVTVGGDVAATFLQFWRA